MQISQDILKIVEENQKADNVLLLAMSTLPFVVKENVFYYEDNDLKNYYTCRSQLAPETECIMGLLSNRGKQLDRIVVLGSKESFEDIHKTEGKTAFEYYKNEIEQYVSNKNDINFDCHNGIIGIKMYEPGAFFKAVEFIKGDCDARINLYIDVQGGKRSDTTAMIAITELLRNQNVSIKGRFANDFRPSSEGPYRIHTVDDEYSTYNLVSAMTEFKRYGRGEGLKVYFEGKEDLFAKKLSEAINKVAEAIQLCDMNDFSSSIESIASLHSDYSESDTSDELSIIYKDIMDDYRSLINNPMDYISQVEWCINKGFIQQALTIIESKMPAKIVGTDYFKVEYSEKTNTLSQYTNGEIIENAKQPWDNKENYILRKWSENTSSDNGQTPSGIKIRNQINYVALDGTLQNNWDYMVAQYSVPGFGQIMLNFYDSNAHRNIKEAVEIKNLINSDLRNRKFCLFMKIHMALKEQRNSANHGSSGQRISIDCVCDAIRAYIDIARELGF